MDIINNIDNNGKELLYMKEATGELNMTLVTIMAVAAILAFVTLFVPQILDSIQDRWGSNDETEIPITNE